MRPLTRTLARPFFLTLLVFSTSALALLPVGPSSLAQVPPPAGAPRDLGDQGLAYILEAQRNYKTAVRDYTCLFVAHENMNGKGGEDQFIHMKFREKPFSVNMKWAAPASMANQEVAFVAGKNGDKLRVQNPGILKVAGFMSIDMNDPRAKQHSRHTIREAGIGNLIDRTVDSWKFDRTTGKVITKIDEYKFDERPCYRIETIRTVKMPQFYSYRSVIYLEKNSKYPLRHENYHWPVQGGNPNGDLMETFSYTRLEFNKNLKDADFDR